MEDLKSYLSLFFFSLLEQNPKILVLNIKLVATTLSFELLRYNLDLRISATWSEQQISTLFRIICVSAASAVLPLYLFIRETGQLVVHSIKRSNN